jgi:hypothetical protein
MFSFTSPGMTVDRNFGGGRGPPTIRLQGQTCHRIGSMLPMPRKHPKFAQLYIYDTENELANRIQGLKYKEPTIYVPTTIQFYMIWIWF